MYQPTGAALAGLSEMLARHESERLKHRFQNLVVLTASLGVFLGMVFALCNSLFVEIWTSGKIVWSPLNDILLGMWLFIASVQTTHGSLVFVNKQIGRLPYIFVFEGCVYITLSLLIGFRWGVPGIIGCSVLCLAFFSCHFCLRQSGLYFQIRPSELILGWLRPSLKLAMVLIPLALIIWLVTSKLPMLWRLIIHGVAAGSIGGMLFLHYGLPADMLWEVRSRLPWPASWLLRRIGPTILRGKT
jgi:hypothetical protein